MKSRTSCNEKERNMVRNNNMPTYSSGMSKEEAGRVLKAVGVPLLVFALELFTISNFAAFGTRLICPLSAAMWFVGFIIAWLMPSMRKETLNQTMIMCTIYCLALLGLKMLLAVVSGVGSEMIAASYDQAIPTATGNAIPGYLQSIMWFVAVLVPLGEIAMQGKRLFSFKKSQTLQKTFGQVRGTRNANRSGKNQY